MSRKVASSKAAVSSAEGPWRAALAAWAGRSRRESYTKAVKRAAGASKKIHVAAMVDFWNGRALTLDHGNNIRQVALEEELEIAFAFPGFVPANIRPLFCRSVGPFRWCARSGDPETIYKTVSKVKELIPDDQHLHKWLDMARERISRQGLPARVCWGGLGLRDKLGLIFAECTAQPGLGGHMGIAAPRRWCRNGV